MSFGEMAMISFDWFIFLLLTSFNHKSISLGQSWTVKQLSVVSKGENNCVWSSRKCRVRHHCTEIHKNKNAQIQNNCVWSPRKCRACHNCTEIHKNKKSQIHKYKTIVFDHLGSAGACPNCTHLQGLVLKRAKKLSLLVLHWCCISKHIFQWWLVLHVKTPIPMMADVGANIGREENRNACIHSALENILSFQKLSLVAYRENVPYECDLDFVIKSMSNTLHWEYA